MCVCWSDTDTHQPSAFDQALTPQLDVNTAMSCSVAFLHLVTTHVCLICLLCWCWCITQVWHMVFYPAGNAGLATVLAAPRYSFMHQVRSACHAHRVAVIAQQHKLLPQPRGRTETAPSSSQLHMSHMSPTGYVYCRFYLYAGRPFYCYAALLHTHTAKPGSHHV